MHDSISSHPDCETLSTSELNDALADADERLRIIHQLRTDADPLVEIWLVQERRIILAELNRRKGHWNGDKHPETEQPASDEVPVLPAEASSGLFGGLQKSGWLLYRSTRCVSLGCVSRICWIASRAQRLA